MSNVQISNVQCLTFYSMYKHVTMAEKEDFSLFRFIFKGLKWGAMRSEMRRQIGARLSY